MQIINATRNETYKSVALGSAGELVWDNDGLEDVTVLVKVFPQGFSGSLPCQASDKDFGQCRVTELPNIAAAAVAAHS